MKSISSSSPSVPLPPLMFMLGVGVTTVCSVGPATVLDGLLLSWTGLASSEQMAPCVAQSRSPGSVIVTASFPSGSTVINQRSSRLLTRAAAVTSPLVTVNAWSRIAVSVIETSWVKSTLNVNVLLPSWSCGTFREAGGQHLGVPNGPESVSSGDAVVPAAGYCGQQEVEYFAVVVDLVVEDRDRDCQLLRLSRFERQPSKCFRVVLAWCCCSAEPSCSR